MKKRKANMKNAPKKNQEKFNMKMNRAGSGGKGNKMGGGKGNKMGGGKGNKMGGGGGGNKGRRK